MIWILCLPLIQRLLHLCWIHHILIVKRNQGNPTCKFHFACLWLGLFNATISLSKRIPNNIVILLASFVVKQITIHQRTSSHNFFHIFMVFCHLSLGLVNSQHLSLAKRFIFRIILQSSQTIQSLLIFTL